MKHLGDITLIKGNEVPIVDCIIGGSPCQDLSLAGKRAGLAGARSGLYMEQIRIIKEMREADALQGRADVDVRPRYMVWENVPGAFSTNGGKDFAAVLEEAIRVAEPEAPDVRVPEKGWPTAGCFWDEMGKWSVAWRVLDARFWGTSDKPLPQRRRRIALVADFGGLSAPEILFVRKSVSGNLEPGKPKGKEAPRDAGEGSGRAVPFGIGGYYSKAWMSDNPHSGIYEAETSRTLDALNCGYPGCNQGWMAVVQPILDDQGGSQISVRYDGMAPTLMAEAHGNLPCVMEPITYNGANITSPINATNPQPGDMCHTLSTDSRNWVIEPVIGIDQQGGKGGANYSDSHGTPHAVAYSLEPGIAAREGGHIYEGVSGTLRANAGDNQMDVAYGIGSYHSNALKSDNPNSGVYEADTSKTLDALNCGYPGCNQEAFSGAYHIIERTEGIKHSVRRLTPLECERLQGFPDGWTDIGEWVDSKGKKHKEADSPRYKAVGNSVAIPPWKWVLKRLCACYERDATMASLFDGIGGFPYIWEQLNGKGSCLWASEIEEFPMAVTKMRFGG